MPAFAAGSRFLGRIALVVGGSRGIGKAIVQRLAAEGAAVAFTYVSSPPAADELVASMVAAGGEAMALRADSGDASALGEATAEVARRFGRIDILVVNAGIMVRGLVDQVSLADFDRIVAVNVKGVFAAMRAAAPHIPPGGRIVTIGSNTAVRTGFPGSSLYSMTKGAVASLVRGAAIDFAARGITVNNVQPGPTDTDMTADPEFAERVKMLIPLGRRAAPAEIAGLVAYLASAEAGFVTGASLTIDGGYVA